MHIQNHNAFSLCRDRNEKIACIAEAMRRLGEGCTEADLKNTLGITTAELHEFADEARALAVSLSIKQTRASVPARRAA